MTCAHDYRPGVYLAQVWRNGGLGSMSWRAAWPGALRQCAKCIHCGHSVHGDARSVRAQPGLPDRERRA